MGAEASNETSKRVADQGGSLGSGCLGSDKPPSSIKSSSIIPSWQH